MKVLWALLPCICYLFSCRSEPGITEPVGLSVGADTLGNRMPYMYPALKYRVENKGREFAWKKIFSPVRVDLEHTEMTPIFKELPDTIGFRKNDHDLFSEKNKLDSVRMVSLFQKYFTPDRFYFGETDIAYYLYAIRRLPEYYEVFIAEHFDVCGHGDQLIYLRINLLGETTHILEHIACTHTSPYNSGESFALFDEQRNITRYEAEMDYEGVVKGNADFYYNDSTVIACHFQKDGRALEDTIKYVYSLEITKAGSYREKY